MKQFLTLLLFLGLLFTSGVSYVSAQDEPLTKEEWQKQMTEWTSKRDALQSQLTKLGKEIDDLKAQSSKLDADIAAAEDELFRLYGMTRAEVESFEKELARHESRVQQLMHMSDEELRKFSSEISDMSKRVDEMGSMKAAQLPRFSNRISSLKENIATLMRNIGDSAEGKTYIVGTWAKNRDCLWNIAKKPDIYANAWLWPKIWQGNREQIKNPDIIHPKQKLKIPTGDKLSQEEKSAANKYYRNKVKGL